MKTKNIFIDTCIFESENFIEGRKLLQLIKLGADGELNIFITRITYNEIINRGLKKISEAKTILNRLPKEGRVLRNLEEFRPWFRKINVKEELQKLKEKIDKLLLDGKVTILEYTSLNIKDVFDLYFENKPPFKEGNKKHEFPDAFSLEIVRNWCKENDQYCYCLSNDNDMDISSGDRLLPVEGFSEFIDDRIRIYERKEKHQERLYTIDELYNDQIDILKSDLVDGIKQRIIEELQHSYHRDHVDEVHFVKIENLEIIKHSIIYVGDNNARMELIVGLDVEAVFSVDDYDSAWYDREFDGYSFELEKKTISEKIEIPVSIVLNHSPLAGKEFSDIKIDSINNDNDIKF